MFYVKNITFVIFLTDLWKVGYGQILSFIEHPPSFFLTSEAMTETQKLKISKFILLSIFSQIMTPKELGLLKEKAFNAKKFQTNHKLQGRI